MVELIPGTTDAAVEKHVPAVEVDGKDEAEVAKAFLASKGMIEE